MSRAVQAPAGLYASGQAAEMERHAQRMAELNAMQPTLHMLDALADALKAQGVALHPEQISNLPPCREIFISSAMWDCGGRRLFDALLGVGFQVVAREPYASFETVHLTQGQLQVRVHVNRPAPAPSSAPTAGAAS